MKGNDCFFRHSSRTFKQNHRHFYTPQMFKLETMYQSAPDKKYFLDNYPNVTERLSVFAKITETATQEEKAWGLVQELPLEQPESSNEELSEGEFPELGKLYALAKSSCSGQLDTSGASASLNTSVDSGEN
jgi:hypothetical protein